MGGIQASRPFLSWVGTIGARWRSARLNLSPIWQIGRRRPRDRERLFQGVANRQGLQEKLQRIPEELGEGRGFLEEVARKTRRREACACSVCS